MNLNKLDKRAKGYWLSVNLFVVLIAVIALVIFFLSIDKQTLKAVLLPVLIPSGVLLLLLIVFPFIKYHFYSYGFNEKHVVINYGVIFKHRITIPVCQIQDLHIVEGPLMMLFGLSGIIFSTAGSNFTLPAIEKANAKQMVSAIEEYLITRVKEKSNEEVL